MRTPPWQAALLVVAPVLSLLYLLAIRLGRVTPSFVPVWLLAVPVVLAAAGAVADLVRQTSAARGAAIAVLAIASVEAAWLLLCGGIVGFAVASRSG